MNKPAKILVQTLHKFQKFYKLLIAICAILFVALLPEIFSERFYPVNEIRETTDRFIRQAPLAISYDGFSFSFYRGVTLHRLKVSAEPNFHRGRILLYSERLRLIQPVWKSLMKPEESSITLDDARLNLWIDKNEPYKALHELRSSLPPKISLTSYLNNTEVSVHLKESSYKKNNLHMDHMEGVLKIENDNLELKAEYEDPEWGSGQMEATTPGCFPVECGFRQLTIAWQGSDLSVPQLNWWLGDLSARTGILSGKFKLGNLTSSADYELNTSNIALYKNDSLYWKIPRVQLRGTLNRIDNADIIKGRGEWNGNSLEFDISLPDAKLWPQNASISLTGNPESSLHLPENLNMQGLHHVSLQMRQTKARREFDIDLLVKNGALIDYNPAAGPFTTKIPIIKITGSQDSLDTLVKLARGSSDLKLTMNGPVAVGTGQFRETAFPVHVGYTGPPEPVIMYQPRFTGTIESDRLSLNDMQDYYKHFYSYYSQSVIDGMQHTWVPSRLRDKKFFIQYLMLANISSKIDLREVEVSGKDSFHLDGNISHNGLALRLNLRDKEDKVSLDFNADYPSNIPFFQGEVAYSFEQGRQFLEPWIPKEILQDFGHITARVRFTSAGERLADFYSDMRNWGIVEIKNPILGSITEKLDIPEKWESLNFRFNRTGTLGLIQNIQLESDKYRLTGFGSWNDVNMHSEYRIRPTLVQKSAPTGLQ